MDSLCIKQTVCKVLNIFQYGKYLVAYVLNIGFYAYAIIGHTQADQLLPQLLMEQFDTLFIQCRHIEHMHEGVWFRKNNF